MTDIARIGTPTTLNTQGTSPEAFNHTLVAGSGGGNRMVMVGLSGQSSDAPSFTITYGGVSMTQLASNRVSQGNINQEVWYIFEADLPSDGVNEVSVSWTGGTGNQMILACDAAENTIQNAPSFEYNTGNNATVIVTDIDSGNNTWSFACANANEGGQNFSHNLAQVEIADGNGSAFVGACTSTIYVTGQDDPFSSTKTGSNSRMQRTHVVVQEQTAAIQRQFETTITVVSTVTAALNFPREYSTTIAIVSTVDPSTFIFIREMSTAIAFTSGLTTNLVRAVAFDAPIVGTSALTVAPFERAVDWNAVVVSVADISGEFQGVFRLFEATVNAVAVVTAQFGSDFDENKSSLTPGNYIELFIVDTTVIGGSDVFRFVPSGFEGSNVIWQGEEYTRFPIEIEGFEWNATAQAPPQPILKLSNVNKFVLAAVISLGDLVGAKVTRFRTYTQFLDGMPQEDPNAHFPPDIFFIQQKVSHSKLIIEWSLSSALDLPGVRLPRRQILRDQTTGNLYAPGVSQVRFRGR